MNIFNQEVRVSKDMERIIFQLAQIKEFSLIILNFKSIRA